MNRYRVKSVQNYPSYTVLSLEPKRQGDVLNFYPGQYATISVAKGLRPSPARCFSMVSSPNQTDELQFAMRITGKFTERISGLQVGDAVNVQGPFGEFVINPSYDKRILLIAGGIGITPFMSMLRSAGNTPMTLLYACRAQAEIPFFNELISLQKTNPNIRVIFFVSDGQITSQPGVSLVSGQIDAARLKQITGQQPLGISYFVCGPNGFRDGLEKLLTSWGVDSSRIISESFNQTSNASSLFGLKASTLTYLGAALAFAVLGAFITTIDLVRHIPKTAQAASNTSTPAATVTPASTQDDTTATESESTAAPVVQTRQQTYQPPTSSVS